jgi:hypothetical protein
MALNIKSLMPLDHPTPTPNEAEVALSEIPDQKDTQHREHNKKPKDGLQYLSFCSKDLEIKKKRDKDKKIESSEEEKEANLKKLDILE